MISLAEGLGWAVLGVTASAAAWGLLAWKAWRESRRRRKLGRPVQPHPGRHDHWGAN